MRRHKSPSYLTMTTAASQLWSKIPSPDGDALLSMGHDDASAAPAPEPQLRLAVRLESLVPQEDAAPTSYVRFVESSQGGLKERMPVLWSPPCPSVRLLAVEDSLVTANTCVGVKPFAQAHLTGVEESERGRITTFMLAESPPSPGRDAYTYWCIGDHSVDGVTLLYLPYGGRIIPEKAEAEQLYVQVIPDPEDPQKTQLSLTTASELAAMGIHAPTDGIIGPYGYKFWGGWTAPEVMPLSTWLSLGGVKIQHAMRAYHSTAAHPDPHDPSMIWLTLSQTD